MSETSVKVFCPNAHRVKMKISGSTTVLQILQNACQKQGFDEAEYDIKYQRKVLDVTAMAKYLSLPNNAHLEMLKRLKPRQTSPVLVLLQVEDGRRLQHEFPPSTSLYSVLDHFDEGSNNCLRDNSICVYTRQEYKGLNQLKTTTLKSMGLISGKAVIRLLFRESGLNNTNLLKSESCTSSTTTACENITSARNDTLVMTTDESNVMPVSTDQCKNTDSILVSTDQCKSTDNMAVNTGLCSKEPAQKKIKVDATCCLSETNSRTSEALTFSHTENIRTNITAGQDSLQASNMAPLMKMDDSFTKDIATDKNKFKKFKFPTKLSNTEEDIAIDPLEMKAEVLMSMPCDRLPVLFHLSDMQDRGEDMSSDLSDDFFNVTIEDLRKRLSSLKSAVRCNDEGPLLTKTSRERKEIQKTIGFDKVAIRFLFPEQIVLQGIFRPLETVGDLKSFLRTYLSSQSTSFELFTTPPRLVLNDDKLPLYKAKLIPAANIYISGSDISLAEKYKSDIRSLADAKKAINGSISKAS